ncbi:MAG: polyphosphate polymerase domain-containing protein [Phototrophicaceae bacterium]
MNINSETRPYPFHNIEQALDRFTPIQLSEMAGVSLLNRIDTKYLFPLQMLLPILEQVQGQYRILDIDGIRLNQYHTVYYDEPEFTFYTQHHNQHADRYKVRARQYVDTHVAFFEVKHKTNKKRTVKSRLPLESGQIDTGIEPQSNGITDFVEHHVPIESEQLEVKLWNDYRRLTLVNRLSPERVTIDLSLSFGHENSQMSLPGFAIAEVKQAHFTQQSPFIQQMRNFGIRSSSFSKYCAGVYLLYDNVKTNNFKPVMRQVQQLVEMENLYASVS